MKKLTSILFLTTMMFAGCSAPIEIEDIPHSSDDANTTSNTVNTRACDVNSLTFEKVKNYLDQCGYDTSALTEHEDYYLIDSDMGFYKERLAEEIAQTSPRMVYTSLLDKEHYRMNINYTPFEFSDSQIFINAVNEWNNVKNCCLNFTSSNLNNDNPKRWQIDLTIQPDPFGPGAYPNMIFVEAPTKGRPGTKIIINTNTKLWKTIDATQRKYAIMHAIGHLVGLGHYDFSGKHYPNTIADPNTIMQDERGLLQNNSLWQGFTGHDINALVEMYYLEPATHKITCQPEITGSDKTKMVVGTEYTLTASYEYDWLVNPAYSYEVIAAKDVVTYSEKNNTLKLKFLKGGSCTVRVRATDAYGEKKPDGSDYAFEVDYYAYPDKPTFTYPSSIGLNTFYTFRMALNNPDYKNVTYKYTVGEEFFDNNTDRSVDIEHDGKGTARIRFNDFGKYTVTAEAFYEGKSSKFVFGFTKLYRPDYTIDGESAPGESYGNIDLPVYTTTPTGDNLLSMQHVLVHFDTQPLMPHRMACDIQDDIRQQCWHAPERVDYRILEIRSYRLVTLNKGDSSFVRLPPGREYWHPDSINYLGHTTRVYPYAWIFYTEDDRCGLLEKQ